MARFFRSWLLSCAQQTYQRQTRGTQEAFQDVCKNTDDDNRGEEGARISFATGAVMSLDTDDDDKGKEEVRGVLVQLCVRVLSVKIPTTMTEAKKESEELL